MNEVEFTLGGTPPSLNKLGKNWQARHRIKKQWQQDVGFGMIAAGVPRKLKRVEAEALLTFTSERRRDEGNFRSTIEKFLGDSLIEFGFLPDDTPDRYRFGALEFQKGPNAETTLRIRYETRTR